MTKDIQPLRWRRRDFLTMASAASLGGLLRGTATLGQGSQAVATEFKDLRQNVGVFTGRGGTIGWFVSPDAVAVVDSQFPDTAQICLDGVNQRSGSRTIDYLMITHHHGDHTGGGGVFRPVTRRILAHENVPGLQKAAASRQNREDQQTYPDATFGTTWVAELGKEKVQVEHLGPAHTGGDSVIHFQKANVVHLGDLVFNRRHPFIDRPAGASIAGWIEVLEKVLEKFAADTIFIHGHAGEGWEITGRKVDLIVQRDYLSALLEQVHAEVAAGKSRESIVGYTEPLRGFKDHGPLIPRVLEAAYEEVTA